MHLPVSIPGPKSGSAPSGPVVERQIAPLLRLTSSSELTYADIRSYLDANGAAKYRFDQIYVDMILVGGGGSGAAGWNFSKGIFGGFPGQVVRRRVLLSDLLSSPSRYIYVMLGIGGEYESDGFQTEMFVWEDGVWDYITWWIALGGRAGVSTSFLTTTSIGLDAQKHRYEEASLLGYKGSDVSIFARYANEMIETSHFHTGNLDGPGIGGFVVPFDHAAVTLWPIKYAGGDSSCLSEMKRSGGTPEEQDPLSKDGQNADPEVFESFGGGGGPGEANLNGQYSGIGGRGGTPGGGGGAAFFNGSEEEFSSYLEPLTPGVGGDGGAVFKFSVWESVN
ncbi:MAG: hypothetical protein ACK4ZU_03980 [Allorhizobium sp.]